MARGNPDSPEQSQLVPVSEEPLCSESPIASLDSWITPAEHFYIRNHFLERPDLNKSAWRLVVNGEVHNPLSLSFDDILVLPSRELVVTLECAGNSRAYMTPPAEGLVFRHGAVSTARWKGVPLPLLLDKAGLRSAARDIVFKGADYGEEEEEGVAFGLDYGRSLPLDKALHPDTLLAYEMNGEALTPAHGYPVRLIVPGWYGMASVKWLVNIEVWDRPYDGFFQKRRYVVINEGIDFPDREPVSILKVKSLMTRPRHGEVIQEGPFTIRGLAWSGNGEITKVEVSTEGGRIWRGARLLGKPVPNAWRLWEVDWYPSQPGHYILMVRATDSSGDVQPTSVMWNFRGYANNSIHTIAVEVPNQGTSS